MKEFIKNKGVFLIIPIFLIFGLIRRYQITSNQLNMGQPTMSGMFALYSYIFIGICLTIVSSILKSVFNSKIKKSIKIILVTIVLVIGFILITFSLIMGH